MNDPILGQRIPNAAQINSLVNATSPVTISPLTPELPVTVNAYHLWDVPVAESAVPQVHTQVPAKVVALQAATVTKRELPCVNLDPAIALRVSCNCPRKYSHKCNLGFSEPGKPEGLVTQAGLCMTCPSYKAQDPEDD